MEICRMKFLKGNPLVPCTGIKFHMETWHPEPGRLQQYIEILVTMSNVCCNEHWANVGLELGTAAPVFSDHSTCFILECCNPMRVEGGWCRAVTEGATVSALAGWLELTMSGESCGGKNIVSSYWWGRSCLCVGDCNSSIGTFPVSGQKLSPRSVWAGGSKDFAFSSYICSLPGGTTVRHAPIATPVLVGCLGPVGEAQELSHWNEQWECSLATPVLSPLPMVSRLWQFPVKRCSKLNLLCQCLCPYTPLFYWHWWIKQNKMQSRYSHLSSHLWLSQLQSTRSGKQAKGISLLWQWDHTCCKQGIPVVLLK